MANPAVEFCWGGGTWKRCHRDAVRPTVEEAVDLNAQALQEVGVDFTQPKRLSVWRCSRNYPLLGTSGGPVDIELYIRADYIKRRKVASMLKDIVLTAGHEVLHSVRSEWFDSSTLTERVASEGLAYMGEAKLSDVIFGEDQPSAAAELITLGQDAPYGELKKRLARDRYYDSEGHLTNMCDVWLEPNKQGVAPGYIVGATEINRRLQEGNELNELMRWPAQELLDLKVA